MSIYVTVNARLRLLSKLFLKANATSHGCDQSWSILKFNSIHKLEIANIIKTARRKLELR